MSLTPSAKGTVPFGPYKTWYRVTGDRRNGRPAVVVQRRTPDGGLAAHGVLVLEISGGAVAGIDAFINPALLPRFGFSGEASSGRS